MRIAIIATGSRGDVEPYIALGKGLDAAGHEVRLVAPENFEALVSAHGLSFWPMKGDVQDVAQSEEMRRLLEKGNFIAITRETAKHAERAAVEWAAGAQEASRDMDLLIGGIGGLFLGVAVAQKLGMPFLQAYVLPFTPTKAFPSVLLPGSAPALGGSFNALTHHMTRQMMWQGFRSADKRMRTEVLDLPAAPLSGPFAADPLKDAPVLYGFSPSVLPKPADWGETTHVTGYWFLDAAADWNPPPGLEEFLAADPKPVYVGFGSMANRDPAATTALVLDALAQSKQRAVLMSGWSGLHKDLLPDSVYMLESAPHAWLFPRVAAVVHHGGAGTTAAGLRAGVPNIVTPFFADQFFWGKRVADLGAGPEPVKRKGMTAERLGEALRIAVSDEGMRRNAAALGAAIRAEDGIGNAVAVIERYYRAR
jgi:UDP:flavonoid glycosyltransferase YjiC (YdhE family)